jgi:DNA end-binding protein Ku
MLDKKDHSHIHFKRVNEKTGQEVTWENIVKGYKIEDQYVILSDKDFESASPEKSKVIEISAFVEADEIDSMYYENPYYLEPDKTGAKAYALLREALEKTGKAGVASFVLRTKETLAVLRADKDVIVLNRIRYQQEIRDTEDLVLPKKGSNKEELEVAIKLIESLSGPFDISEYKDTYSESLMKVIKAKAKGEKVTAPKMKVVHSKATDLMSQLKASLEKRKKAS